MKPVGPATYNEAMIDLAQLDLASLRIVKYPDPVLNEVCEPVDAFDASLRALAERMLAIMYASRGVGLAAPQVGVPIRLFVANPTAEAGGQQEGIYVNPQLIDLAGEELADEGCLSFPDVVCKVKRATRATLRAANPDGEAFTPTGEGLLARVFQHECDHLDGILLSDRMSTVARLANRRVLRALQAEYDDAAGP